jgi:hypothetical protein
MKHTCASDDLFESIVRALQNEVLPLRLNKTLAVSVARVCLTIIKEKCEDA